MRRDLYRRSRGTPVLLAVALLGLEGPMSPSPRERPVRVSVNSVASPFLEVLVGCWAPGRQRGFCGDREEGHGVGSVLASKSCTVG